MTIKKYQAGGQLCLDVLKPEYFFFGAGKNQLISFKF